MTLKQIGPNQTEIEREGGLTILYSYSMPVAAFVPGRGGLCSSRRWSATTSRHVNEAIRRWDCTRVDVEQAEIDKLAG